MDIVRYCKWCGKEFVAHKLQSMYCSHSCINGAYKARKRAERIENFENAQKTTEEQTGDFEKSPEFLSPKQVATLLGVSRSTIYRYASQGIIKAVQFRGLTIIRKSDIEKAFNEAPNYRKRPGFSRKQESCEYYTMAQICEKYKIGRKGVIGRCDRLSIPKIYDGRNYYFNKTSIDVNFSDLLEDIDLANYYTVEQIMEKFNMSHNNVISYVYQKKIPRINRGKNAYYSKAHIDNCKRRGENVDINWFSYEEIIENYGLSKDQISNSLRLCKVRTEKRGKFTMIYRTDFIKEVIKGRYGHLPRDPENGHLIFKTVDGEIISSPTVAKIEPVPPTPEGYYSTEEISKKYSLLIKRVQTITREENIPRIKIKSFNFYEKMAVDVLLGKNQFFDGVKEWISVDEIDKHYKMTPVARRSFIHRHSIPTKLEYGKLFYSKTHIDKIKNLDFDGRENYYSVKEVMEKFNLSKDLVFYYSRRKSITKKKCGQQVYFLKEDFKRFMAMRAAKSQIYLNTDD